VVPTLAMRWQIGDDRKNQVDLFTDTPSKTRDAPKHQSVKGDIKSEEL